MENENQVPRQDFFFSYTDFKRLWIHTVAQAHNLQKENRNNVIPRANMN